MSRPSSAPLVCLLIAAVTLPTAAADDRARVSFVESWAAEPEADRGLVTAIGLRGSDLADHPQSPAKVVVLVDTSATQTGDYRRRSLDALAGLLEAARPDDRFLTAAADLDCRPLCDGFHPSRGEAIQRAELALDARTPLGATDIVAVLDAAAALFDEGGGPRAIVYIGDGPGLAGVDPEDYAALVDRLRTRRISVSSLGIGPQVNWPFLASLASATGGMLMVPDAAEPAKPAGARIGHLAVQKVCWPESVALESGGGDTQLMPPRMPPLRPDRDSILLVLGPLESARLELELHAGPSPAAMADRVSLDIPPAAPREDNAYLGELVRNAWGTAGLFLPLLGREGLDLARATIRGEAATLAALSSQASAVGAVESAARLAEASLRRDPDNPAAAVIREVALAQIRQGGEPPRPGLFTDPAADVGPVSEDSAADLAEIAAMRRVRAQQLERETAVRIREARQLLSKDPDAARDLLKDAQSVVRDAADLDADIRERLLQQLEGRIRESIVRSRAKLECDLAAERRAAIGRERMRLTAELQQREERIKQLVERYNALIEEGIRVGYAQSEHYIRLTDHDPPSAMFTEPPTTAFLRAERGDAYARGVAEEIEREAPRLWANHPVPMPAREIGRTAPLVAQFLHYDAQNWRTRRDRQRGFMDALHEVDVAAIPYPTEPPIIYPAADRWRRLTEMRKRYKSVDLASPSEVEKRIYDTLDQPLDRPLEFNETPLRAVIEQLQDAYGIPILPDLRALTDAGMDLDATTVTARIGPGVRLRSALRLILRDPELTYIVKDEVLQVTTPDEAQNNLIRKVYPVADLVVPISGGGMNPFMMGGGMGMGMGGMGGMGMGGMGMGGMGMGGMGGMGMCWVAREVYGPHDGRWLIFRDWMVAEAPPVLRHLYATHGPQLAGWLRTRPVAKAAVRHLMDLVVIPRLEPQAADTAGSAFAGGHWQVAEAQARVARRERVDPATVKPPLGESGPPAPAATAESIRQAPGASGLPRSVLDSANLRAELGVYLAGSSAAAAGQPQPTVPTAEQLTRLAELRFSAAELGQTGQFARAAELIEAAIACGHAEPWMYESLAVALEVEGRPREDIERVLLSGVDFATQASDLMRLAEHLARFGSDRQAVRICKQLARLDPLDREAYALAMTVAARSNDDATLRWACPGVLANEWPAGEREIATRAARLAKSTIERLTSEGKADEAEALRTAVEQALVRDLVIDVSWTGDADVDILVEEPPGSVCSRANPRSLGGGTLLADEDCPSDADGVRRERYTAMAAFPGTYNVLVRRVSGSVTADTITVEMTLARGTDQEQRLRQQVPVTADEQLLTVDVPPAFARRQQPLFEAQVAQDMVAQQQISRSVLAQQLDALVDPQATVELSKSRSGSAATGDGPGVAGQGGGGLPFFGPGGAVGYQPVIETLPEGVNMTARAVVSADRRYVRITAMPMFTAIGQVTQFNFAGGGAQGMMGGGMGGMGGGMGGMGGGMGGMGMGGMGGGMGGMGMGGMGGMGGGMGMGGMGGGMGMGGMGMGGMGMCWVAREVYGVEDPRWLMFRTWLTSDAPAWLHGLYARHGEAFAGWIHDKPAVKVIVRLLMDRAIAGADLREAVPCPPSE